LSRLPKNKKVDWELLYDRELKAPFHSKPTTLQVSPVNPPGLESLQSPGGQDELFKGFSYVAPGFFSESGVGKSLG